VGYFDALTSSYFKATPDGRRLFFPWGVMSRGYVIGSEQDYERLRGQLKIYTVVSLVLIIGSVAAAGFLWSLGVVALLILFYLCWLPYLLRRMQPSDERLSLTESMTSQARTHGVAMLWLLEIISVLFVVAGIFILIFDPREWLTGLASIIFFGLCAAMFTRMLILRRRANRPRS